MTLQTIRKGSVFVWTMFLLAGSLRAQTKNKLARNGIACVVPEDEIAVLTTFYEQHTDDVEVIVTETDNWSLPNIYNLQLAARGRGLSPDLRNDFDGKNGSSCKIQPFASPQDVHFISAAEERQIFRIGWNEFHRRFGKKAAITSWSRVGFNSDKTLALVHEWSGVAANGAAGTLFLLQRVRNKWVINFDMQTGGV